MTGLTDSRTTTVEVEITTLQQAARLLRFYADSQEATLIWGHSLDAGRLADLLDAAVEPTI